MFKYYFKNPNFIDFKNYDLKEEEKRRRRKKL